MPPRSTRPVPPSRGPVTPVHRGPQAAAVPASIAPPFHAPNAALLIDFDNVTMGIRSDLASELKTLLSSDIVRGKVSVQRAYADWRRYPQYIVPLAESSIDLIYAPAYGSSKKNATDIRLAIDALELVFTRPEIGTFILLSGDSDFSSLVLKLKEYGKYVIGVGIRESASDLLVQNCDEYYSYTSLAGLVNTRDEEIVKWDPWELAGEAVQRMARNGDVMRADRLKQVMQQIDSSFDEKNLGMSKFSRFVMEAARRGIVALTRMDNGQYEVAPPQPNAENGNGSTDAAAATPAVSAPVSPAPSTPDRPSSDGDDRRPRGRGRRGRSGRDRDERRPRSDAPVTESATSVASAPEPTPPSVPAAAPVAEVKDGIGVSGMRLTRDEAFSLVKRAVAQAAPTRPASASAVRAAAFELLGRDSESLSDRNFTRILKDAHDADIIDLRRRGNDFLVSSAVAAEPIAEQLGAAEAAQTQAPAAAAVAPAPRGMGHRGVLRGRGLPGKAGKGSGLSADLLMLGVVDDAPPPAANAVASQADGAVEPKAESKSARGRGRRGGQKPRAAANDTAVANAVASEPVKASAKAPATRGRKKGAAASSAASETKPAAKPAANRTAGRAVSPAAAKKSAGVRGRTRARA